MVTERNIRDQQQDGQTMGTGRPPGGEDPSRRVFVLGGAAIGVAGIIGGRRTARLSVRERRIEAASSPLPLPGSKAAVGATVSTGNPGGTDRLSAAHAFDRNMGGRKMAMAVERFYWPAGHWDIPSETATMIQAGVSMVASFTPVWPVSLLNDDITNLGNALGLLKSATNGTNSNVDAVCLTHEPNNGKFQASDYQAYIAHYGSTVIRAGYNLAYIPLITKNQDVEAYYPTATYQGQPMITRMYGDFYCDSFDNGATLDQLFSVATAHGTPRVGLGEFGRTSSGQNDPSDGQFNAYCNYLIGEFGAWNQNQHDSAAIMFFTNGTKGNPTPANYTSLENLWDALSINA